MNAALHPSERAALRAASAPARAVVWRRGALIVALVLALIAVTARAGIGVTGPQRAPASPAQAPAALPASTPLELPLAAATASPAAGTTGTIDLPPVPVDVPALPVAGDVGIVPAKPFSMRGASTIDRVRALECLSAAIYYEAASEPDDGQRAVAQVILNRVRHPAFPATVCGVIYQGSERSSGCQFSYACDGSMARIPSRSGWARAARNAAVALGGYVFAPVGLATHYHTYAVTPSWNRTLVMTDAIGAHFFHRWKGYWGTAAAFHQSYAGHEPLPGPHEKIAPATPPTIAPIAPTVIAAAAPVPVVRAVTPPAQVQPDHRESGTAIDPSPSSQVLDRWKDSGKPLR